MTFLWGTYGNGGLTPIGLRGHYYTYMYKHTPMNIYTMIHRKHFFQEQREARIPEFYLVNRSRGRADYCSQ